MHSGKSQSEQRLYGLCALQQMLTRNDVEHSGIEDGGADQS